MRHSLKFQLLFFLPVFLLILLGQFQYSLAEEQKDNPPEEKQETPKKAKNSKDDISKHIIESETGVYYVVQEGDTLWDLSKRFSDSPWVWPDLWEENKQITNPHLIYPGEKIRLYQKKDADELLNKGKEEKPEKPKVAKEIPIQEEKEKPYYYYSRIDSIGFIKRKEIDPLGYLFKVKDDRVLISVNDLVYVKPNDDASLDVGNQYTLYRTITPIKPMNSNKKYKGVQYYLTGVIEIIKKEEKFSVAKVVQSFRAIKINDLLMPYERRDPKVYITESQKDLKGKLIIPEERSEYAGDDFVAFIDKGSKDGVQVGQYYTIYYQDKEAIGDNAGWFSRILKTDLTPVDYAKILVLHTEERTSTVLITQADTGVPAGAEFREVEE